MAELLFLFVDGVGLASADATDNPLAAADTPFLSRLLGGKLTVDLGPRDEPVVLRSLDATLGHPGLPQSATGQATLLTGRNCAELMGRHYGPWPGPTIRRALRERNLFMDAAALGGRGRLVNTYPPRYLEHLGNRRTQANVPVHAALASGLELPDLAAYARGEALSADLSGEHLASLASGLPRYRPYEAGTLLASLAARSTFTFFDFWLSDRVGHRGSFREAVLLVEALDEFLAGVYGALGDVTLLLTSDHGNLEAKRAKGHTRSPVPLLAAGKHASSFRHCRRLEDVAAAARTVLAAVG